MQQLSCSRRRTSADWNHQYEGRAWVFQVSLFGFELILNQAYGPTQNRAGHGRAFIGLEDDQAPPLLRHIRERGINAMRHEWGRPTLVLRDPDGNELFFWIPDSEWANLPPDLPTLDPERQEAPAGFGSQRVSGCRKDEHGDFP